MQEQQKKVDTRTINIENDGIIRFDKKFWLLIIGVVILILTLIFLNYGRLFSGEKESKPVTADSSGSAAKPPGIDKSVGLNVDGNSEKKDHESSEEPTAGSVDSSGAAAKPPGIDKSVGLNVDGNSEKKDHESSEEPTAGSVDSSGAAAKPSGIDKSVGLNVDGNSEKKDHESSEEPTAGSVDSSGAAAKPSGIDKSVGLNVDGNSEKKVSECNLELPPNFATTSKKQLLDIHQYFKEDDRIHDELSKIVVPELFSSPLDLAKTASKELLSDENIEFFTKIIDFIFLKFTLLDKKNDYFSYNEFLLIHFQPKSRYTIYVKTTSEKYIAIDRYILSEKKAESAKNTPESGEISPLQDMNHFAEIYSAKISNVGKTTASKALWTVSEGPKSQLTEIRPEGVKNLLLAIQYLNNQGKTHRLINFSEIKVFEGNSGTTEVIKLVSYGRNMPIKLSYGYDENQFSQKHVPEYLGKSDKKNIDIYQLGYYLYFLLCKNQNQLRDEDYLSDDFQKKIKTFFETGNLEFPEGTIEDLKDFIKSCLRNNSGETEGIDNFLRHNYIIKSETH